MFPAERERAPVGAVIPATGRYAAQGAQVRAGVELWAEYSRTPLLVEDDESSPERASRLFLALAERGCRFVLGPYGGDSARAAAAASGGRVVVWNHGAGADDVQRMAGVVSIPSPASRYLVALGRAVAGLRPGASVALVTSSGPFGRFARDGLIAEADALGLRIAGCFSFRDAAEGVASAAPDAVLACGPVQREVELFRALAGLVPRALAGGVAPGLAAFPSLLGGDPEGLLTVVQWHPELDGRRELGPSSADVVAAARLRGSGELDYVAAQAYAAALVAERCLELAPDDPLDAARALRTTTFFGAFELDASGIQRAHRLAVVRWRHGRRELLLSEAA